MTSYFHHIAPIRYEGPDSPNELAFKHYDKDRLVLGRRMEDHLRFAVCYWHNFVWTGLDPFGGTIVCRVSVSQISECGSFRSHVIGFGKEGDFSCRHGVAKARATPKALYALHQAALNDAEGLLAAAREHYAQKAQETAEPEPLAKAA